MPILEPVPHPCIEATTGTTRLFTTSRHAGEVVQRNCIAGPVVARIAGDIACFGLPVRGSHELCFGQQGPGDISRDGL